MTTNIREELLKIGLSEKESFVLLVCLSDIKNTPTKIEKETKIPRSTIYKILDSLKRYGFIYEKVLNKKRYYYTTEFDNAVQSFLLLKKEELKQIEENIKKIKPKIKKIEENSKNKVAGEMQVFEGLQAIKKVSDKILKTEKDTFWIGPSEFMTDLVEMNDNFLRKNFSFKRINKNIFDHGILTDRIPDNVYYNMKKNGKYKILKTENKFNTIFASFGDSFIILKNNGNKIKFYSIEDSDVAELFKTFFKDCWDKIK